MSALNLALRFACELAALAAVGWCGWRINPVLGVVFPPAFLRWRGLRRDRIAARLVASMPIGAA